jgi:hypothetical protein
MTTQTQITFDQPTLDYLFFDVGQDTWRRTKTIHLQETVLQVLQKVYEADFIELTVRVTGCGDSGDSCDMWAYTKDPFSGKRLSSTINREEEGELETLVWSLATKYNPGFEINDGGGYSITFYFKEDGKCNVDSRGWFVTTETSHDFNSEEE